MAPPKSGIKEFLDKCKKYKVQVYIWAARCNNYHSVGKKKQFPIDGTEAMYGITRYMHYYGLYYTDIAIFNKPLGGHYAKYLIDDRSRPDHTFFTFGD
jgi:hypothetical protein